MAQSGSKGRILGEFQHSLDEKGRVAIPARYRDLFKEGGVVTRGFDPCLVLYPNTEWDAFADKISSLPTSQADARQIVREVFSAAQPVEPDRLGRFVIPPLLRQYASLDGEVTLAGVGTQLEIWDRRVWDENRSSRADIATRLERFGI